MALGAHRHIDSGSIEPDRLQGRFIQGVKQNGRKTGGKPHKGKNPHAPLGRLGGLKGGRARAAALTPRECRTIASKAAQARVGMKGA